MNKGRRNELARLKLKSRLQVRGLKENEGNFHVFKSHGAPCSCWACRGPKYRDMGRKSNKLFALNEIKVQSC